LCAPYQFRANAKGCVVYVSAAPHYRRRAIDLAGGGSAATQNVFVRRFDEIVRRASDGSPLDHQVRSPRLLAKPACQARRRTVCARSFSVVHLSAVTSIETWTQRLLAAPVARRVFACLVMPCPCISSFCSRRSGSHGSGT
jgi:hypothetical protein